jgi:myo-inositol-1(or 4)-monophosphatase
MNPLLNIATQAARIAGHRIINHMEKMDQITVEYKGKNDYVSQVDKDAEQSIIQTIQKYYPGHDILAEESGLKNSGDHPSNTRWIIDPLDGTTNFLHQFPQFCVSIAVEVNGRVEHAAIFDPTRDEMFTASRGEGAYLNNRRIRVSQQKTLENALLATGFPYHDFSYIDAYLASFKAFMTLTAGLRRPGSAALDLAYTACGRVDGFYEMNLKPWDIAAGMLIVKEAGGLATDFNGSDNALSSGNVIATNPKLYKSMAKVIGETIPKELRK